MREQRENPRDSRAADPAGADLWRSGAVARVTSIGVTFIEERTVEPARVGVRGGTGPGGVGPGQGGRRRARRFGEVLVGHPQVPEQHLDQAWLQHQAGRGGGTADGLAQLGAGHRSEGEQPLGEDRDQLGILQTSPAEVGTDPEHDQDGWCGRGEHAGSGGRLGPSRAVGIGGLWIGWSQGGRLGMGSGSRGRGQCAELTDEVAPLALVHAEGERLLELVHHQDQPVRSGSLLSGSLRARNRRVGTCEARSTRAGRRGPGSTGVGMPRSGSTGAESRRPGQSRPGHSSPGHGSPGRSRPGSHGVGGLQCPAQRVQRVRGRRAECDPPGAAAVQVQRAACQCGQQTCPEQGGFPRARGGDQGQRPVPGPFGQPVQQGGDRLVASGVPGCLVGAEGRQARVRAGEVEGVTADVGRGGGRRAREVRNSVGREALGEPEQGAVAAEYRVAAAGEIQAGRLAAVLDLAQVALAVVEQSGQCGQ